MKFSLPIFASLAFAVTTAQAITIQLDFSEDTSTFFSGSGADQIAARAAIQAAANDLGKIINTQLTAVGPTNDANGNNVDAIKAGNVTMNWSSNHTNPSTGADVTVATPSAAANTIKIFVGARPLSGATLGQGGAAGAGAGASYGTPNDFAASIATSNAYMNRGGPMLNDLTFSVNGTNRTYQYGYINGNLWFDNDGSSNFQFDHTIAVASGKVDFYSVALHELTHAIGFGGGRTWLNEQNGTSWTGAEAIALNGGSGANLVVASGHIDSAVSTATIGGSSASGLTAGANREALMAATIAPGVRKYFTDMDIAMLKDMGWSIVPEPSSTLLVALSGTAFLFRRRSRN